MDETLFRKYRKLNEDRNALTTRLVTELMIIFQGYDLLSLTRISSKLCEELLGPIPTYDEWQIGKEVAIKAQQLKEQFDWAEEQKKNAFEARAKGEFKKTSISDFVNTGRVGGIDAIANALCIQYHLGNGYARTIAKQIYKWQRDNLLTKVPNDGEDIRNDRSASGTS